MGLCLGELGESPTPGVKVAVCSAHFTYLKLLTVGEVSEGEGEGSVSRDGLYIAQYIHGPSGLGVTD